MTMIAFLAETIPRVFQKFGHAKTGSGAKKRVILTA